MLVNVYDAKTGAPAFSTSSPHVADGFVGVASIGKAELHGDILYVPVFLDGKGIWKVSDSMQVTSREDHDVVVLQFVCNDQGAVSIKSDYVAQPNMRTGEHDKSLVISVSSNGELLGLSTSDVADGFGSRLSGGMIASAAKKVTFGEKVKDVCPPLPPRQAPMAMYIPPTVEVYYTATPVEDSSLTLSVVGIAIVAVIIIFLYRRPAVARKAYDAAYERLTRRGGAADGVSV